MPYIKQERRDALVYKYDERPSTSRGPARAPGKLCTGGTFLYTVCPSEILTPGELNFVFTAVIREYLRFHGLSYQTINDILGALEGAKAEFYRRVAVPYEGDKIVANGDVYP